VLMWRSGSTARKVQGPMVTWSPCWMPSHSPWAASLPLTWVPCRLPASAMNHSRPRNMKVAWRRETAASSRTTSQRGRRPTETGPGGRRTIDLAAGPAMARSSRASGARVEDSMGGDGMRR
jgi:hypothetical protein